jgi:putative nucleotidyltransferase with HDIG domain
MSKRDRAIELLSENTPNLNLQRHCLSVAACLEWYAARLGKDQEIWACAGILHDFDYEQHPVEHPLWGIDLLKKEGWSDEVTQAIAAHYPSKTGVTPETPLERHLFACDELSGLITAVAYVRPSKSILEVNVSSVLKKLRTPSFAAGVNRDDVRKGALMIGLPLEQHIDNCVQAMQGRADELGLKGNQ